MVASFGLSTVRLRSSPTRKATEKEGPVTQPTTTFYCPLCDLHWGYDYPEAERQHLYVDHFDGHRLRSVDESIDPKLLPSKG